MLKEMPARLMKAIVVFYRVDSDTAFERQRSLIPINKDIKAVESFTKNSTEFLGLKQLVGLGLLTLN